MRHYDVNVHASNITEHILEISKQCIPNRIIKIKPSDPPWITTAIKRLIRKRKRLFRKAKTTDDLVIWRKFRRCRNDVINQIRVSKQSYIDKMTEKLKSDKLTSKDWWRTLKYFISPNKASGIPSIQVNNSIITDEIEKANLLNNYFRDQTLINDNNVEIPLINYYNVASNLDSITFTPEDLRPVLQALPLGKAAGPDGIGNRILKELADQLAHPLCSLLNQSFRDGRVPNC